MRMVISEIISESEVALLPVSGKLLELRDTNGVLRRILEEIEKHIDLTLKPESYCLVERRPAGHEWHKDTGFPSEHMPWCTYGGSIVLNRDFQGGELKYRSANGVITEIKERRALDLHFHSSDEFHMIEPSTGTRAAFYLF